MNTKQDLEAVERRRSPRSLAITAIFIILLTVLFSLLARSMMRHHFVDGGNYNNQSQHE